jgi:CheY-like chemotaxis protein
MDLIMPVMDGIEATRRIRQVPELKDMVIIASSASVFDFNRQDSLDAGCNDFLNKPIRADDLFEILRRYLGLEWMYESDASQDEAEDVREPVLVPPPKAEIQALAELVEKGKITAIRHHIGAMRALGREYGPFTDKLDLLAKSLDMDQLLEFLKPYLPETQ